ncbi:hypothetical protein I302_101984 [Kwoniella bestiolae CBS 10118]|uniref:Uncharacterized protein n=1 Tax=Kwoniella bestiolae CBS 10118 TaxID=1296100 RepID=A0A1B9GDQ5_9TREE|nr:hypothetical protein I302_00668 [Kwoniella bestiolae CBS 10118]OCF29172.1 hypothetical protein I302_00668 [Kwoniella bestiolae CBS 10118]
MFTLTPSSSSLSPKNYSRDQARIGSPVSASTAAFSTSAANPTAPSSPLRNEVERIELDNSTERLQGLLKCIITIIHGYSDLNHSSNLYLTSLEVFRTRVERLLTCIARHRDDHIRGNGTSDDDLEEGHAEPLPSLDELIREVARLEDEWWNSEVVASWYGPRPRPNHNHNRRRSFSCSTVSQNDSVSVPPIQHNSISPPLRRATISPSPIRSGDQQRFRRQLISAKDLSALHEEEADEGQVDGESKVGREVSGPMVVQGLGSGGWLRRDSSYVGLHDE